MQRVKYLRLRRISVCIFQPTAIVKPQNLHKKE